MKVSLTDRVRYLFPLFLAGCLLAQGNAAQAPAAARKRLVAETQEEYNAYRDAVMQTNLPAAERAATDFVSRFPESALREPLYQSLMLRYQRLNDAEKALAAAEKALLVDPDNIVALVTAANVIAERTQSSDPGAAQRFAIGKRYAERALTAIDSAPLVSADASPAEIERLKSTLRSVAHNALGTIAFLQNDYSTAETQLVQAAEASPSADALSLYRLALAARAQQKNEYAMESINRALDAAEKGKDLVLLEKIKSEKKSLVKASAAKR